MDPDPIQVLMDEHRIIERVLKALETNVERLGEGPFPREFFENVLAFLAGFADGCHHAKEEQRLFPLLKERGIPEEGGPIGVMLYEHTVGRGYLTAMRDQLEAAEQGNAEAVSALREAATGYIELLRQHIRKEDNILFAMARHVLAPADVERLRREFACVEHHHVGEGVHKRYLALAEELVEAAPSAAPAR